MTVEQLITKLLKMNMTDTVKVWSIHKQKWVNVRFVTRTNPLLRPKEPYREVHIR